MSPSSVLVVATLFLSACSPANKARVDELNEQSYAYHYRNLDSTKVLAERALKLSEDYSSGRAEAYNNLAFVCIAKMDYKGAKGWLRKVEEESDNQIELAIADVQNMRLCQRESHNKDFATSRRIFQGIAQQIEHNTGNLLLIGNHFMAAFQVINIQMQPDLLALGSKLEVAHPHRQGLLCSGRLPSILDK